MKLSTFSECFLFFFNFFFLSVQMVATMGSGVSYVMRFVRQGALVYGVTGKMAIVKVG